MPELAQKEEEKRNPKLCERERVNLE